MVGVGRGVGAGRRHAVGRGLRRREGHRVQGDALPRHGACVQERVHLGGLAHGGVEGLAAHPGAHGPLSLLHHTVLHDRCRQDRTEVLLRLWLSEPLRVRLQTPTFLRAAALLGAAGAAHVAAALLRAALAAADTEEQDEEEAADDDEQNCQPI